MQALKAVLLCVLMAVTYGIIHDQITARICVEYFTVGHPPVFGTADPTRLGLGWGVIATWWVGVLLGVPLAAVARLGSWPKRTARSLMWPLVILMAISAVLAVLAGFLGEKLGRAGILQLNGPIAASVPAERHAAYIADLCAHTASYAAGFFGGGIVIVGVGWKRWKAARLQ